jgi:hypothetical protein
MFNHLLEQQVSMVQKVQRGWDAPGASDGQQYASVPQFVSATSSGIPLFHTSGSAGGGAGGGAGKGGSGGLVGPPGGDPATQQQQQAQAHVQGQGPGGAPEEGGGAASGAAAALSFPGELAQQVGGEEHTSGASPLLRVASDQELHKALLHDISPLVGGEQGEEGGRACECVSNVA